MSRVSISPIEAQITSGVQITSGASDLSRGDPGMLVSNLMPYILAELRKLAPAEARAIAGEAAASRPLDGVSLAALADWLRDQRFDGLADQVAAFRDSPGGIVVLQARRHFASEVHRRIAEEARAVLPAGTPVLVLPPDLEFVGVIPKE